MLAAKVFGDCSVVLRGSKNVDKGVGENSVVLQNVQDQNVAAAACSEFEEQSENRSLHSIFSSEDPKRVFQCPGKG